MATPLSTYSAFSLNNRPSALEWNRNGAVNMTGVSLPAQVGQHWIPSQDNMFDLGENSTPKRWRNLYLANNASVGFNLDTFSLTVGNTATFTNGPINIGTNVGLRAINSAAPNIGAIDARFGDAYFNNANVSTQMIVGGATSTGTLTVTSTIGSTVFGNTIRAATAGTRDIGSAAVPWRDIFITGNIYKNGVLYNTGTGGGGGGSVGDLVPDADNVYKIGNSGNRWKEIWVSDTGYINRVLATANVETATGDLVATNGSLHVGGGISTGEAGIGTGNINMNGSLTMFGSYQMSPNVDTQGTLGGTTKYWNTIYAMTANHDTIRPRLDAAGGVLNPFTSGTTIGTALAGYQYGYFGTIFFNAAVTHGLAASFGVSTNRIADSFFNRIDTNRIMSTTFLKRGYITSMSRDDTCYDHSPIMRGVIDGTALSLSGVKYSSATSNGFAYPNTIQWCSNFAVNLWVYKCAPGDYWLNIVSLYSAADQLGDVDGSRRGLPRKNNSFYNGAAPDPNSNPRCLPVIELTPYYFPQTRSDQGVAMDTKIFMCVTDIRTNAEDESGIDASAPDGTSWNFRVKTSNGKDAVFAFVVWSGYHGQYKNKTTNGGATSITYDNDVDYYTDYVSNLSYNAQLPLRGAYRTRMQALMGDPGTPLYDTATGIAFNVVGEFVPFL